MSEHIRFGFVGLLLLTVGCRMYGNADSREALLHAIDESVTQMEREGAILRQDADKLSGAAELNGVLQPFADRAREIADLHKALVKRHQELSAELAETSLLTDNVGAAWLGPDRYRRLHRMFGSMISEWQKLMGQRDVLARDLGEEIGLVAAVHPQEKGRYQIAPHHYQQSKGVLDLTDILARLGEAVRE